MFTAARESFPDFRRYLHAKARALGLPVLAWYDLLAPVGASGRVWSFGASEQFIVAQFGSYSPRLSAYAARAFRERWIDAEPRPGKRDGAFCMPLRADESRVFANFKPTYDGMSTLAHELGHGYHNMNLAQRTMLQRNTPMTLAETASIFCETIVREAALKDANAQERIEILEASLVGSCQVVVDITSRFLLEQGVFETRRKRELSVDELNDNDASGPARDLRRRPRPEPTAPLYVGDETALLQHRALVLQLPVYVRPAVWPGTVCPLSARTPRHSARNTTTCSPRPGWPTRQPWLRASASTRARPTSGAPAWIQSGVRWISSRTR